MGVEICITFWESRSGIYIPDFNTFPILSDIKSPPVLCESISRNPVNTGGEEGMHEWIGRLGTMYVAAAHRSSSIHYRVGHSWKTTMN